MKKMWMRLSNSLEEKNKGGDSPLAGKLDMNTVGCSGHSMGGLESEQAIIKDQRVKTSILNNSGDLGHTAMSYVAADRPIAIVYGNNGMERPNAEAEYGHGSGPWDGMAATVAWFRWHLGGEVYRKADFVGSSGKYINEPIIGHQGNWKGQCKNF